MGTVKKWGKKASKALSRFDDQILQPITKTAEAILSDPKAMLAVAAMFVPGVGPAIGSYLTSAMGVTAATAGVSAATMASINAAIGSTLINTVANGGDLGKAIQTTAASYLGAQAGSYMGNVAADLGANKDFITLTTNVTGRAAAAAVNGQNVEQAITSALVSEGASFAVKQIPGYDKLTAQQKSIIQNGATQAAQGKDPSKILESMVQGAAISYGVSQIPGLDTTKNIPGTNIDAKQFVTKIINDQIAGKPITQTLIDQAVSEADKGMRSVVTRYAEAGKIEKELLDLGFDENTAKVFSENVAISQQSTEDIAAIASGLIDAPDEVREGLTTFILEDATDLLKNPEQFATTLDVAAGLMEEYSTSELDGLLGKFGGWDRLLDVATGSGSRTDADEAIEAFNTFLKNSIFGAGMERFKEPVEAASSAEEGIASIAKNRPSLAGVAQDVADHLEKTYSQEHLDVIVADFGGWDKVLDRAIRYGGITNTEDAIANIDNFAGSIVSNFEESKLASADAAKPYSERFPAILSNFENMLGHQLSTEELSKFNSLMETKDKDQGLDWALSQFQPAPAPDVIDDLQNAGLTETTQPNPIQDEVLAKQYDDEFGDYQGAIDKNASAETKIAFGDAYSGARRVAELEGKDPDKATFSWTNPKTGETGKYVALSDDKLKAQAAADQARINLMPVYGGSENTRTGRPADKETVYIDTTTGNVVNDDRVYDEQGNVISGSIELANNDTTVAALQTAVGSSIRTALDVGAGLIKGGAGVLEAAGTVYGLFGGDMDNAAVRTGAQVKAAVDSMRSNEFKADQKLMNDAIAKAGGESEWLAAWETAKQYGMNPIQTAAFVAEQGVSLLVGGGAMMVARGLGAGLTIAEASSLAAGALIQGGSVAKETYDELKKQDVPEDEAKDRARAVFGVSSVVSAIANKYIPGAMSNEQLFAAKTAIATSLKTAVKGEMSAELVEETAGKIASNVATGKPWSSELGTTAVQALIGSGIVTGLTHTNQGPLDPVSSTPPSPFDDVTSQEFDAAVNGFSSQGYAPSINELAEIINSSPDASAADIRKTAEDYADQRVVSTDEATQMLADLGYTDPTADQINQFVGVRPEADTLSLAEQWVDANTVTRNEAIQTLADLGYTNLTEEQVNQFVGKRFEPDMPGTAEVWMQSKLANEKIIAQNAAAAAEATRIANEKAAAEAPKPSDMPGFANYEEALGRPATDAEKRVYDADILADKIPTSEIIRRAYETRDAERNQTLRPSDRPLFAQYEQMLRRPATAEERAAYDAALIADPAGHGNMLELASDTRNAEVVAAQNKPVTPAPDVVDDLQNAGLTENAPVNTPQGLTPEQFAEELARANEIIMAQERAARAEATRIANEKAIAEAPRPSDMPGFANYEEMLGRPATDAEKRAYDADILADELPYSELLRRARAVRDAEANQTKPTPPAEVTPKASADAAAARAAEEARVAAQAEADRQAQLAVDAKAAQDAEAAAQAEELRRLAQEEADKKAEEAARAQAEAERQAEIQRQAEARKQAEEKAAEDARIAAQAEADRQAKLAADAQAAKDAEAAAVAEELRRIAQEEADARAAELERIRLEAETKPPVAPPVTNTPAGATAAEVQKIVDDALKSNPNLTALDVQKIVDDAVSVIPNLTSDQVRQIVSDELAKASTAATPTDVQNAVDKAKADLTKAIDAVSTGVASGNADLKKAIEDLKAAGLTSADVQQIVDASATNQSAATKQAIAEATSGLATSTQLSNLQTSLSAEIQAAKDIGIQGDEALQAGLDSLSQKMGIDQAALLTQLGTTAAELKTQFAADIAASQTATTQEIADTRAALEAAIAEAKASGLQGDAALKSAIDTVAEDQQTNAADLLTKLGTTEAGLKADFAAGLAGVSAEVADVQRNLSAEIQAAKDIGLQGDAALQAGLNSLAQKMGVDQAALLSQLGTTAEGLKTQFAAEIAASQTATAAEIASTKVALEAAIAEAKASGLQGDAALKAAIDSVAATQQTNSADLLAKLGTTEAGLKTEFAAGLAGVSAEVADTRKALEEAIQAAKDIGLQGDAALQAGLDSVAANLNTTKEALLGQLGTTEQALRTEFASGISGLEAQMQQQYNALTAAQKAEADARVAQGQTLAQAIAAAQATTTGQITALEAATKAQYDTLTAAQKATADALVAQGQTLQDAITTAKTETAGQIAGVETRLTDAIAAAEAMGLSRDQAITAAVESVAADLGTTKEALLGQLGKTEEALRSEFSTGIAGLEATTRAQYEALTAAQKATADALVTQGKTLQDAIAAAKTETAGQISGVESRLTDAIAAAEAMGLSRDQAITAAVESVAADLGTTKDALLAQLGMTEQALRTEFGTGLAGVSAEVKAAYDSLSTSQKALADQLQQQGVDMATAIQQAQAQTAGQIGALTADVQAKYDALTAEQKALANQIAGQGVEFNAAIEQAKAQTQQQITDLGTDVNNRINQLMQQGQTYQQATQQAFAEVNAKNAELSGLIGTQGRTANQSDIDALTQMLSGQRSMDLNYDVTGDKQITQADIDYLTGVVGGTKTDWMAPAQSPWAATGLYGQIQANELKRQQDLAAAEAKRVADEQAAATAAKEAQRQSNIRSTMGQAQQGLRSVTQQLQDVQTAGMAPQQARVVEAGPGFDISDALNTGFFSGVQSKKEQQNQQQPTKIAVGGYIDDLLAEDMTVDDLLNLLR